MLSGVALGDLTTDTNHACLPVGRDTFFCITFNDKDFYPMLSALPVLRSPARRDVGGCALRNFEVTMPAIASLEDLKAAQKEGLSIYAMLYALCSMLYEDGAVLDGRMSASCGYRNAPRNN